MNQYSFTERAAEDLCEIHDYIFQDNPTAADRMVATFEEKCAMIAGNPRIGRGREELGSGLRSFPVGNYSIFYRIVSDGIEIVRVLSGHRDIPSLF
jgi:toxin ParE1/3/4